MDDVRIFDFELDSDQVANLFNPSTDLQAMLEISGLNLTTPNTALTLGKTEAVINLNFDVTHSIADSSLNGDENGQVDLDSAIFGINQDNAAIATVANALDNTKNILTVLAPVTTNSEQPSPGSVVGTIKVPLVSDSLISSVDVRNDPTASSTLLTAKAQAYRYLLAVHSIGGSSGQAEVRGNDAIMALGGGGFLEDDATHAGTEGSLAEISATYLHELGHLLNILHGGPAYFLDAPTFTLDEADQNCVPIQKSVMSYTGQLPSYLGSDWALRFNEVGRATTGDVANQITLNENTLVESAGVSPALPNDPLTGVPPLIVYATPESTITDYINTRSADGAAIDWNGDLDTLDASPTPTLAEFDINNFGLSGCLETPGELFEIYNEPANFDFNFRDGPYGVFDGAKPTGVPDQTKLTIEQANLAFSFFDILPPIEEDGTEKKKAGANIPVKFKLFTQAAPGVTGAEITDADVRIVFVSNLDGGAVEIDDTGLLVEFETSTGHYHFDWKTDPAWAGKEVGLRLVLQVDSLDIPPTIIDYLFIINKADPLIIEGEGASEGDKEGVTILVTFK